MSRFAPRRWRLALAAIALSFSALALALTAAGPAAALECPTPEAGGHDIIRESAANIAELSSLLASGDLDYRIPDFVAELRRRHPNAKPTDIVNYMVTAYCPVVAAQSDLDEAGKRARLDTFASQISHDRPATLAAPSRPTTMRLYIGLISTLRNLITPSFLSALAPSCSAITPLACLLSCTSTVLTPFKTTTRCGPCAVIS